MVSLKGISSSILFEKLDPCSLRGKCPIPDKEEPVYEVYIELREVALLLGSDVIELWFELHAESSPPRRLLIEIGLPRKLGLGDEDC